MRSIVVDMLRAQPSLSSGPFSNVMFFYQRFRQSMAALGDGIAPPPPFSVPELQLLNSHEDSEWLTANVLYTAVHFAAHCGSMDLLTMLHAEAGLSLVEADCHRSQPMHYAAREGQVDAIKFLRGATADLSAVDGKRRTLAHLSCYGGHAAVLRYLHEEGHLIPQSEMEDETCYKPVHVAATNGSTSCLDVLAASGVDLTCVDVYQRSPAAYAAEQGHVNVLTYLVETVGPSMLMERDKHAATIAHYAARRGNLDALAFLHAHGVDLDGVDRNGRTPAFWCGIGGKTKKHIDALHFLRERGADFAAVDSSGTNLTQAVASTHGRECNLFKYMNSIVPYSPKA